MPYSQNELKEVADKTDNDPTLEAATAVPGAAEADKDGNILTKYHPVTLPDGESYVRKPDSTLDWKSYKFEMVMSDGTRHDFLFTAKDDADAEKKVRERIAATNHQDGASFKLSRLEAPKEVDFSTTSGQKTVKEKKAEPAKEAKAADKAPKTQK